MKKYGYIETDPKMPWCGDYCSLSYSMFSEEGDILVNGIVDVAKGTNADWPWAYKKLEMLGKTKGFEEATDTMVREAVFDAIGYDNDTPFYI
jgi:hypothetical protein